MWEFLGDLLAAGSAVEVEEDRILVVWVEMRRAAFDNWNGVTVDADVRVDEMRELMFFSHLSQILVVFEHDLEVCVLDWCGDDFLAWECWGRCRRG